MRKKNYSGRIAARCRLTASQAPARPRITPTGTSSTSAWAPNSAIEICAQHLSSEPELPSFRAEVEVDPELELRLADTVRSHIQTGNSPTG